MKANTLKYWKKHLSLNKLYDLERKINLGYVKYKAGQLKDVESKIREVNEQLNDMAKNVSQSEFEEHLECNLCCSWEDFANIDNN